MATFVNIAAYKFVDLDRLAERRERLLDCCRQLALKGTILISKEGINLFLAGTRANIDQFLGEIRSEEAFSDLEVKESLSDHQPFSRMLVRLKKEIISMGMESIRPTERTSPKLKPQELKAWLDEGKPVTLLDVRNDYEVEIGTFQNAVPVGIDHFRKFPAATRSLPQQWKQQPVVMFCTGGIRCEKAGPLMESEGFEQVYQLDGGILKYFEECGGEHWEGDCFVFDKRVAVDPNLQETDYKQCFACQSVLTAEQQASPYYQPPDQCPVCYRSPAEKMAERIEELNNLMAHVTTPLPGSQPYENRRPMHVPLRYDRHSVLDFLDGMHAHVGREAWQQACAEGRIRFQDQPLEATREVRAGTRIDHVIPGTVEPPVSNQVTFLWEDAWLIAVNKPAPLPMHPCGRFNRHSLKSFLQVVYPGEPLRILHRLDANTTGVVVLGRTRKAARQVHRQFESGTVAKIYLARVAPAPPWETHTCKAPIGDGAQQAGGRAIDPDGLPSTTEFKVLQRFEDGTALLECRPLTGRTNQIRLHLAYLGFPIVGDPTYREGGQLGEKQTLALEDPPMCLHAASITVVHPHSGQSQTLTSPPPEWAGNAARGFQTPRR